MAGTTDGAGDDGAGGTSLEAALVERFRAFAAGRDRLPPLILYALGLAFVVATTANFYAELSNLAVTLPPAIAAAQGYLPGFVLLYAGYWLGARSGLDAVGRWRTALGGVAGLILFGGITATTLFVRWAEGRVVAEARYVVIATAGAGAVLGLLMGVLYARSQRNAERAAETRDKFELMNSILRHDILNRTMIIRSRANFIRENADGEHAEFADTVVAQSDDIADQIERTRALLNSLSGERSTELEPVALRPIVEENAETIRTTHEAVEVSVDVPELSVAADDMLGDVIGNLLSNAVEHNDEPTPELSVTARERDGSVEVRVADNGPGVADEMKDAIFRRDETGLHEDGTGSGFGLFFVDTMMRSYGGAAWVEDNEPKGAVFALRFHPAEEAGASPADRLDDLDPRPA